MNILLPIRQLCNPSMVFTACLLQMLVVGRCAAQDVPFAYRNVVTYRGNEFIYSKVNDRETQVYVYPQTGRREVTRLGLRRGALLKMNGERVYDWRLTDTTEKDTLYRHVEYFLAVTLFRELGKMPDGTYKVNLPMVVVDTTGKLVYYELYGITNAITRQPFDNDSLLNALRAGIDHALEEAPLFRPCRVNGQPVIAQIHYYYLPDVRLRVSNHKTKPVGRCAN